MNIINPLSTVNPPTAVKVAKVSREVRENNLRIDQVIHGSVTEGGEDRVLLNLGQRQLWAETKIPLKTGQRLTFQVVATSPRLELRLVEDLLAERLGGFLHLLGEDWNIKPALSALTQEEPLFTQLSTAAQKLLTTLVTLQTQTPQLFTGQALWEFVQCLGLNLERRLWDQKDGEAVAATLKGALLEATHQKAASERSAGKAAGRLLQNLELFQMCQVRLDQQGLFLLPVPLPFLDQGYLIVEEDKTGSAEEEACPLRFSLHCSLQGLGNLRIEFLREPQGLFLRFVCDSQEKIDHISPFLEELKTALSGFPLRSVTLATGIEDPAKTLLRKILPEGDAMLDTRV